MVFTDADKTLAETRLRSHYPRQIVNSPAGSVRIIAMSMSVCLSVRSHNSKTTRPNFTNFCCACCLWPWPGPALAALRCFVLPVLWMTLCFHLMTSCRVVYTPKWRQNTRSTTAEITIHVCSTIKTGRTRCELFTGGKACHLRLPCLKTSGRATDSTHFGGTGPIEYVVYKTLCRSERRTSRYRSST